MKTSSITRRSLLVAGGAAGLGAMLGVAERSRAADTPPGKILFARSGSIWQWQGGDTEQLLNDGAASDPRWSPDGTQFLFIRTGDSFSDLYLHSLDGSADAQLTANQAVDSQIGTKDYVDNSSWVADPSWSNSGVIGYASDYYTPYSLMGLFIMNYAGAEPQPIEPPINADGNYEMIEGVSLSSDGSVAAYTSRTTNDDGDEYISYVGIQDLGSLESGALVTDEGGSFDPAMEPYGSRVAVAIRSGEVTDVWLVDRDGGDRVQITNGANATKPCWSSDGSWLGYMQMVDFKFEVWAVSVQGASIGQPQKLFNFDDIDSESGLSWFNG